MDKRQFADALAPCAAYYNRKLDDDTIEFYFEELGSHHVEKFKRVIRQHMAKAQFFPKVADLNKLLGTFDAKPKGLGATGHNEWMKHMDVGWQMLAERFTGTFEHDPTKRFRSEELPTTLFPMQSIIDSCMEDYDAALDYDYKTEWGRENAKRSRAYACLNVMLVRKFAAM